MTAADSAGSTVLITVDLDLSLVPGALPESVRQALEAQLNAFREAGKPILHILGGRALRAARIGDAVDPRLLPDPAIRLYGHFLARGFLQRLGPAELAAYAQPAQAAGGFAGTSLESYLRRLGADTLLVAGCRFDDGPRAFLKEARRLAKTEIGRGFKVILLGDAVSGMHALARAETSRLGAGLRGAPPARRPAFNSAERPFAHRMRRPSDVPPSAATRPGKTASTRNAR
jgi:nicotinamidase-related amidase